MLLENGDGDLGRRRLELGIRQLGLQPILLTHIRMIIQLSDPSNEPLPIAVDAVMEVASQVVDVCLLSVAAQIDGAHDEVVDQGVLLAVLVDRRH